MKMTNDEFLISNKILIKFTIFELMCEVGCEKLENEFGNWK